MQSSASRVTDAHVLCQNCKGAEDWLNDTVSQVAIGQAAAAYGRFAAARGQPDGCTACLLCVCYTVEDKRILLMVAPMLDIGLWSRSPPPAGSQMHRRLVAIGRAAAAYGKFAAARDSLEAAGQWAELMPLCALQGDFDAIRDYAARVSGTQVRANAR